MRVRTTVSIDDYARYVIAKYFDGRTGGRTRATREQVRAFVHAAINRMVRMQAEAMTGRQRSAIRRLQNRHPVLGPEITLPREHQLDLLDGAK